MQWLLSWLATEIATLFGAKVNEVNYVLCLLLAFPLGVLYRWIHYPTLRILFSLVTGGWLGLTALGIHSLHIVVASFVCYLIMLTNCKRQHHYVFFWAFLYLSVGHIYRQWTDYLGWSLDFTLPLMIVTQKVISLSYALHDGMMNSEWKTEQKGTSIRTLPNILEFYAFILFPPSLLVGPYLEFVDWQAHLQNRRCIKDAARLGFGRLVQGLGCLTIYLIGDKWLPIQLLGDERFLSMGHWLVRFLWIDVILFGYRFKYYFAWKLAEGALASSGMGRLSEQEPRRFEAIQVIDILGFELAENPRELTSSWNKTTNVWLRRYVYERMVRPWNLYYAFVISAFWHGFYPGYYLFFVTMSVVTSIHRKIRKRLRPLVTPHHTVAVCWRIASILLTRFTCSYFIISFTALSFEASFKVYRSLHLTGHAILLIAMIIFYTGTFDRLVAKYHFGIADSYGASNKID
ncbi:Membrane-bound O-acyltransferase domain-containing protein 2 [Galdieria sulphuraria]|uniref:Membrane bound O-acyl transferase (MBOAT) family protein isoform 1 n=1 Tax=Galdieria sulphuraria TaxID=130081 RepID=M2X7Q6_GALSU|nr:membrane bound O-acyl transferase (MBOAT) family protein isoform 1 [Galdieria sulphuraria]EME32575.1 membrane bound O-acyl transferase (MBOAT) family protein isoform 1 [Galdieria sulphuraria]GJD12937.1 Membrane-bound O-acyltransferase domain-containing protein 2 [Galdieria sulphuraria]|eukprot:XP_005709095.1 membrane bound O-acyl transferase (MBOAT) family protein isoform 1 [Galdieria sulphuraria]